MSGGKYADRDTDNPLAGKSVKEGKAIIIKERLSLE
jgi:hypothetical protein